MTPPKDGGFLANAMPHLLTLAYLALMAWVAGVAP